MNSEDWFNPQHLMRQGKHRLWLGTRVVASRARVARDWFYARRHPFVWDPELFATSHAGRYVAPDPAFDQSGPVERVIWGVWAGDNPMSSNRRRGWESVQRFNPDVDCRLVTPATLNQAVRDEYPIHPAYENLSLEHRADYLRCYLMHIYGGGYTDIKDANASWAPFFDRLEQSAAWALGYPVPGAEWVGDLPAPLSDLPRRYHSLLIGDGAFIMRSRSPLTTLWFDEVHRRMDYYADDLARFPGATQVQHRRYPIRWTGLLGDVNGGILLRYHDKLLQEPRIMPRMTDYR